jgi:Flp pilus assembly protein TadG
MKPLLRAVLIVDALLLLAFGLLFLLTPWTSLYNALLLAQTQPALVGQAFGIALIGLAWLALHASIDGGLTSSVARAVGHVNWLTGVLMLVWLLGLHTPALTGFGQIVAVLTGVVLLVLGLGGVRLSGAVRRREKLRVAEATAAERAERQAAKDAAKNAANRAANEAAINTATNTATSTASTDGRREPVVPATAGFPVYRAEPLVEPAMPAATAVPAAPDTRPLGSASTAPLHPAVDEPGLSASERAARVQAAAARDEARNAAADAPNAPRPPFHG